MALEQKTIEVTKELDDVLLAVVALIKDVKEKKQLTQILTESIPAIIAAVDGVDQIDDELKAHQIEFMRTAGLRVGDIVGAFLK